MLKTIRKLNFGWIIILMGVIIATSGFTLIEDGAAQKTLLCFDGGCVYVQAVSNIAVGVLSFALGLYLVIK